MRGIHYFPAVYLVLVLAACGPVGGMGDNQTVSADESLVDRRPDANTSNSTRLCLEPEPVGPQCACTWVDASCTEFYCACDGNCVSPDTVCLITPFGANGAKSDHPVVASCTSLSCQDSDLDTSLQCHGTGCNVAAEAETEAEPEPEEPEDINECVVTHFTAGGESRIRVAGDGDCIKCPGDGDVITLRYEGSGVVQELEFYGGETNGSNASDELVLEQDGNVCWSEDYDAGSDIPSATALTVDGHAATLEFDQGPDSGGSSGALSYYLNGVLQFSIELAEGQVARYPDDGVELN